MARWASALGGRGLYTQHGGRHSGSAGRRLGLGGCHPGSLWGHPRSAACVTRRMLGCRTDPIVKTIEHCFGGFPRFGCRVAISASRAPRPPRARAGRGTRRVRPRASHPRCRTSDDGSTTASRPGVHPLSPAPPSSQSPSLRPRGVCWLRGRPPPTPAGLCGGAPAAAPLSGEARKGRRGGAEAVGTARGLPTEVIRPRRRSDAVLPGGKGILAPVTAPFASS